MLSDKPLKAILFDVGGPIVDESVDYDRLLGIIADNVSAAVGRKIELADLIEPMNFAVHSYSPSFTRSVIWYFLRPDVEKAKVVHKKVMVEFFTADAPVKLMDGVYDACRVLADRYILALAGNQMSTIRDRLAPTGILDFFKSTLVSEDLTLQKPDTRFFLAICDAIGVYPENCCVVGDRLDNDIFPANILGMRTIWIKAGPHAVQEPRLPEDVPDGVITSMTEFVSAISKIDHMVNAD